MTEPKVNETGDACPEWCTSAHGAERGYTPCRSAEVIVPNPRTGAFVASARAELLRAISPEPAITAYLHADTERPLGAVRIDGAYDAGKVADLLDQAALATRAQLRQAAANIRELSARTYPEEAEPEAS